jgi:hypothetical protein
MDQFDDLIAAGGESDGDQSADEDEKEYFLESRQRLMLADLLTRAMSHDEYIDYADCRQASFTYKKPSRFREWLNIEHYTGKLLLFQVASLILFSYTCIHAKHQRKKTTHT